MPVQSKSKSANEVLFRLSILCQDLYIDEHVALKFVGAITVFYAAFIYLTAFFINGYWSLDNHGVLAFIGAGAVIVLATVWLNEIMRG